MAEFWETIAVPLGGQAPEKSSAVTWEPTVSQVSEPDTVTLDPWVIVVGGGVDTLKLQACADGRSGANCRIIVDKIRIAATTMNF